MLLVVVWAAYSAYHHSPHHHSAHHHGGASPAHPLKPAPTNARGAVRPVACHKARGPFKTRGSQVFQASGQPYIPYGITVPGLAHSDYQANMANDRAQIIAAATTWCANTVRLQVSQHNLVGRGFSYSAPFMSAIKSEVSLAEHYHLVVVIVDQTEVVGNQPGPTGETLAFWNDLTAVYGTDPQVVFDLFNEPRISTGNTTLDWQLWQRGGVFGGASYLGMQNVVNDLRSYGARNLIWVEGPYHASSLAKAASYPITGGPLMYAVHHPSGAHDTATWWHAFGYLTVRNIAPVVVGEWSNYASSKAECWPDAPVAVPDFLSYLKNHGIGMTVWTLRPGVMVASSNLAVPTRIGPDWHCQAGLDQGAGSDVLTWYRQNNAIG